jgi:hypothetical protein
VTGEDGKWLLFDGDLYTSTCTFGSSAHRTEARTDAG